MKSLRKVLLILFSALFAVSVGLFAASCGEENSGGTAEKVGYTVEVYLGTNGSYQKSDTDSFTGEDEVGKRVTVTPPSIDGYAYNADHEDGVDTRILSENEAENVFSLYYDSTAPAVVSYIEYAPNPPAGLPQGTAVRGSVPSTIAENGVAKAAENGFSITGYRFAGWSSRADGNVDYQPGADVSVEGKLTLYAVWDRGYTDRFGGTDYIFLPRNEQGVAILSRGGVEFRGTYTGDTFTFKNNSGDVLLEGRTFGTQFCYRRDDIAGTFYAYNTYYTPEGSADPLNRTETLVVDAYGNATHTYVGDNGVTVSDTGTIIYNEPTDEYLFTADVTGDGFVYSLGVLAGEDEFDTSDDIYVFSTTNGEGGQYYEFITPDGTSGNLGGSQIVLDGYGGFLLDYDWLTGYYNVEWVYDNGFGMYMYRINAILIDEFGIYGDAGSEIEMHFYTLPLNSNIYGYVMARGERGTYTQGGMTLTLDGFGVLPDSALYTDGSGRMIHGNYTISASPRQTGTFIDFSETDELGAPTGTKYTFLVNDGSFTEVDEEGEGSFKEYIYLHDGALEFQPLLVLYNENYTEGGEVLGKKAEYWCYPDASSDTLELAATGYVTEERLKGGNRAVMRTWHKVSEETGYEDEVADNIVMLLDETVDANYVLRDVYFTFEKDGKKEYTVLTDSEGSGAELWYHNVGTNTLGSLFIDGDGNCYAGGFTVDRTNYYFGTVGYFIYYATDLSTQFIYMDLDLDASGNPVSFTLLPPNGAEEIGMLLVTNTGTVNTDATILRRGNDQALYSPTGDFENANAFTRGVLEYQETTDAGDEVYAFISDAGVEMFRFINYYYNYVELGGVTRVLVYHIFNEKVHGTYSGDGTLVLDGYRGATYTDPAGVEHLGYYRLSSDSEAVYFDGSDWGDSQYLFKLDGSTFEMLDGIYGAYAFNINGADYTFTFDGKGTVTATLRNQLQGTGLYTVSILPSGTTELEILIELPDGIETFIVRVNGNSLVRRSGERASQTFLGDDFGVLILDGYDNVTYYHSSGFSAVTGHLTYIDRADGFIQVRYDVSLTDEYFVLDTVHSTFSHPAYATDPYIYYAEDLHVIAFGADGLAQIDNSTGCYNIVNGKAKVYMMNPSTGGYNKSEFPAPTGADVYTTSDRTYYRFRGQGGGYIVLNGKVTISAEGYDDVDATLSFRLTSSSVDGVEARFAVGGQTHTLLLTNHYWDPQEGRVIIGIALYDEREYAYYPISVSYIPAGIEGVTAKSSFLAEGGLISTRLTDYSDALAHETDETRKISTLTENYVGFGPYLLTEKSLSGELYCGSTTFTFTNAPILEIYSSPAENLYRYLAKFTDKTTNKQYAVIYEKEIDGYYTLYQVVYYDEVEGNGYTVGVGRYFYSNEGYEFIVAYKQGELSNVQLFQNGKIIPAFNTVANPRENTAWMIPQDVDDTRHGWFFSVTMGENGPTAVTVTEYNFVQGLTEEGTEAAYTNFFIDKTDPSKIMLVAYMAYVDGTVTFMDIKSVTHTDGTYVWVVTAMDDQVYTVTVQLGDDGRPLENNNGDWLIVVT